MIKTVSALALATAIFATPAFAQGTGADQVNAPVAPVGKIPSSGLAGAVVVGGAAAIFAAGIVAVALDNDDDDDGTSTSTPTPGT